MSTAIRASPQTSDGGDHSSHPASRERWRNRRPTAADCRRFCRNCRVALDAEERKERLGLQPSPIIAAFAQARSTVGQLSTLRGAFKRKQLFKRFAS
jgi:hypothetical protein